MEPKNIMLTSPGAVKAVTYVNYNVTDDLLGASIREAQDIHVQSITGSRLLYRLQELVANKMNGETEDTIDSEENDQYKVLLNDYVEPFLIAKTQFLICTPVAFKTRNLGVIQNSDTNANRSAVGDIAKVEARYNNEAMRRATALSMFLCRHKSAFPELAMDCGCDGVKPMIGRRFVNVPLNLGKNRGDCCCD